MFAFFFIGILIALVVAVIVFRIIEPIYLMMFNKPLYIFWYPILNQIDSRDKTVLGREFPYYFNLPDKKKRYFEHRVKCFIKHYNFEGKDIEVTQDMKLIIAGTYVMLTFGLRNYLLELFENIIIYPTFYYSTINQAYHKGEYNPRMKAVVFSWEDFLSGHETKDNINLGLHEFTHVLHFYSRKSSDPGAVIFYDEFTEIEKYFDDEYLTNKLKERNYFRDYAYTNKFEFLAVILEHFFETPEIFKKEFPELFERVRLMINYNEL